MKQETPTKKQLDSLKSELEPIFIKDQTFRKIYVEAEKKLGKDSREMEYESKRRLVILA